MTTNPESSPDGFREISYRHSPTFPQTLAALGCSLLVSTYQAGQLVAIGVSDGTITLSLHRMEQVMGVAVGGRHTAVGAKGQITFFQQYGADIARGVTPIDTYDRCLVPATSTVTGSIQCHEVAWGTDAEGDPDLWIVNTAFSCLVGLAPGYSFVPRWRPPFISGLAAEDRCHLNGLAMRQGRPAYVTLMAQSDEPGGWRKLRNDSGAILDVESGEPVTQGLAMPHSPRWHHENLWVLNSGMGRLERVDVANGAREVVALVPGYARGLAFRGPWAFIGLSRIRETAIFGGAPIAEYHDELKCGVGVVDLRTGHTVATFEFTAGVEEIFDIQVVPTTTCLALGGGLHRDEEIWILPPVVSERTDS